MTQIASGKDISVLLDAADLLRSGKLVAIPTETVYGLGANALDTVAVQRIYEAKGRPSYNPLIVHVSSVVEAKGLVREWTPMAEMLAEAFWPGPLTLILPKNEKIPSVVTAGMDNVAIRIPAHPVAREIIRLASIPVAAPSANAFMGISPTTAEHVSTSLYGRLDLIVDGGPCDVGIESTVVSLLYDVPTVLRAGSISPEQIAAVVGDVEVVTRAKKDAPRQSPGMVDRHYAPKGELRLFEPSDLGRVCDEVQSLISQGVTVGAFTFQGTSIPCEHHVALEVDPHLYGARLYATLHLMDALGCSIIYAEKVPDGDQWLGVRDRLQRASTPI